MSLNMPSSAIRLFYSYSHKDQKLRQELEKHLSILRRQGVIAQWHDQQIDAGENWRDAIDAHLRDAQIILLLISPDFLASSFCYDVEVRTALTQLQAERARVIPIILRPTDWGETPFSDLQALPKDAKPVTLWSNRDAAFLNIARGIREVAEELQEIAEEAESSSDEKDPSSGRDPEPLRIAAMRQLWNVTHLRNPLFIGREDVLSGVRGAFESTPNRLCVQVLHGLGGIGKSQIVIEYAYRHAEDYDVIWWIRAEDHTSLTADYASIAQELKLPDVSVEGKLVDVNPFVRLARRWLERHKGWLLIFDNAGDLAELRDYLPQRGSGHILVTSRNPIWRGIADPIQVDRLDRSSSRDFLLKRTGSTHDTDADALAQELGDLPLALEQAGAYIEETGISYSGYLTLFYLQRQELLQRGTLSTDYPMTIASTWLMSFKRVENESPAGADLLNLCALLAPDDIPLDIIRNVNQPLPGALAQIARTQIAFNDAIGALRRYSLVRISEDSLSVHRLVQAVVMDRLEPHDKKTFAEAAVNLANDAFSFRPDDQKSIQKCLRLLPHGMTAAGYGEDNNVAKDIVGKLLNKVALFLAGSKHFIESKAMFERAVKVLEEAHGVNSPNLANALNNLGFVQRMLNEFEEARLSHERALSIDENIYGLNHHEIAVDLYNLGIVLVDLGAREEARDHFQRAIEIFSKNLGADHPDTQFMKLNVARLGL
jgi:tetratricopeptide (TPR) repeat protein